MAQNKSGRTEKSKTQKEIDKLESDAAEIKIEEFTVQGQEITNQQAFDEFQKLSNNYWLRDGRLQETSDMNTDVDLLMSYYSFKEQCSHLPTKEYNILNAKQYIAKCYYKKMVIQMKLAVGSPFKGLSFTNLVLEQKKAQVLELFGKMMSVEEVHRIAVQDWGLQVTIPGLENFRKENITKITELQASYIRDFSNIKLGYKRSRLDELTWLYYDTKAEYEKTKNREDKKFLKELLEAVKKEVEGDLIRIQGDIQMNIEATLNSHISTEVLKKLPINELIITRVCARVGKNPLVLLHRLQNSYYSAFTGFKPDASINIFEDTPEYPSAFVYDLDKLQQINRSKEIEDAQVVQTMNNRITTTPNQKQQGLSLKQIIQNKLKEQQENLALGRTDVLVVDGAPK